MKNNTDTETIFNTPNHPTNMKDYLERRLNHYYELRQIAYQEKVSTYCIDMIIDELERILKHLNFLPY